MTTQWAAWPKNDRLQRYHIVCVSDPGRAKTIVADNVRTKEVGRLIAAAPKLLEKLQQLLSAYEQADHRAGYCCCGDDMERHGDPMDCGHTPVDAGEYAADNVIRDVKALIAKATGGAE